MAEKKCVLTIAGSDSGAGAGIQSDLKTFKSHDVYGVSVITAITAQNTKGVQKSFELEAEIIEAQMKSVFDDFKIAAVKTGMLSSDKVVDVVVKYISRHKKLKLVVDPVILSKNNKPLLNENGIKALREKLLPLAYLVTPNIPEAEILCGVEINSLEKLEIAAVVIYEKGVKNVLIKGGHMKESVGLPKGTDVLFDGRKFFIFNNGFINSSNTHGIGCTLSAAITANLASGCNLIKSIENSKKYINKLLQKSAKIGKGVSPVEQ